MKYRIALFFLTFTRRGRKIKRMLEWYGASPQTIVKRILNA